MESDEDQAGAGTMNVGGRVPVIGITTYRSDASFGAFAEEAAIVPWRYIGQVIAAGGAPLLIPPGSPIDAVTTRLDGLLLSGGPDVEPSRYRAEADPRTDPPSRERDDGELAALAAAIEADLPVLAICRGLQLLNVAYGGTLIQHLPERVAHDDHRPVPGTYGTVKVSIAPSSLLAQVLGGAAAIEAACHHHQAVEVVGDGLRAVAFADDGTIEALEAADAGDERAGAPVLAVQWHPETKDDLRLFSWLIDEARRRLFATP